MNNRLKRLMARSRTIEDVLVEIQRFPQWYLISEVEKRFTRSNFTQLFHDNKVCG